MQRLSLVKNSFWGGQIGIEFPKDKSISIHHKFNNDIIIERDFNLIGKIACGGGKATLGINQLKSKRGLRETQLIGLPNKNINIKVGYTKAICANLDFNVYFNNKRVAYFTSVSIARFYSREYILIFKSIVDIELATFLLIYLTDSITDLR